MNIGDLITTKFGTGFIIALEDKFYVPKGWVDYKIPGNSLSSVVNKKDITKIIPRKQVKEYWGYL